MFDNKFNNSYVEIIKIFQVKYYAEVPWYF